MEELKGKIWKQNCGDSLIVLKKTEERNNDNKVLYLCEFQKYPYKILAIKQNIKKGNVINPEIERVEFVEKIWPQKCNDFLKIIRKIKEGNNKGKWKCEFINYPNVVYVDKNHIIKGEVFNPQIEQIEFIDKIWPQYCGDDLKIIKRVEKEVEGKRVSLWECEFVKEKCIVYETKSHIQRGCVFNPKIRESVIGKKFEQKCGDILIIKELKKENNSFYYIGEFQKHKYEIKTQHLSLIKKGLINNPQIEFDLFIGKVFEQNCGDSLIVLEKTDKYEKTAVLFKCRFLKYPHEILATKQSLKNRSVVNPILPWRSKEGLEDYISKNFNEIPTLKELANSLQISLSYVSILIKKYNLREKIKYSIASFGEQDIKKYINEILNEKYNSYWLKEKDYEGEIDIYIQNLSLGIEFNGDYWHSSVFKDQNYHQNKSLEFLKRKIRILHIWEWEWQNEKIKNILLSIINNKVNKCQNKIYARQCQIKELDYKTYAAFCNKNHLQGECGAKVKLGLFYKDELVQIMSFGCPRFNSNYEWEIIRECSKLNNIIVGGKERLWKYFIQKYTPNSCISYCDFSKFSGDSYLKLGFKKERLNKPGFIWYDEREHEVYQRTPWKHNEYKERYLKLYDCGQLVFVWNK